MKNNQNKKSLSIIIIGDNHDILYGILESLINQSNQLFEVIILIDPKKEKYNITANSFRYWFKRCHIIEIETSIVNTINKAINMAANRDLLFINGNCKLYFNTLKNIAHNRQTYFYNEIFKTEYFKGELKKEKFKTIIQNLINKFIRIHVPFGDINCFISSDAIIKSMGGFTENNFKDRKFSTFLKVSKTNFGFSIRYSKIPIRVLN